MAIYVKIDGIEYPASINGRTQDREWDNRESKTISLNISAEQAKIIFADDTPWSIIERIIVQEMEVDEEGNPVLDEDGNPIYHEVEQVTEWDNSEYSLAGDIIDHRDETCTVKMGKPTDLEEAYEMIYGGEEL